MKQVRKIRLGIILLLLSVMAVLGLVLYLLLHTLILSTYRTQMTKKLADTNKNLDKSYNDLVRDYENFERLQQTNAELAVFYILSDEKTSLGQGSMIKLMNLLSVHNVVLLDQYGNVITSASPVEEYINFKSTYCEPILDVIDTGETSYGVYYTKRDLGIDELDEDLALYGARIDHEHILVIIADLGEAKEITDSNTSWQSVLARNTIGQSGFTFAVNTDGLIVYYPYDPYSDDSSEQITRDDNIMIDQAGISLSDLQSGGFDYLTIFGETYYCGFFYRSSERTWLISAIPEREIISSVIMILIPMLFTVFVLLFTLLLYYLMIIKEYSQLTDPVVKIRHFFIEKSRALLIFSLLTLLLLSVFIQFLYATSVQETINRHDSRSLAYSLNEVKSDQKEIKKRYDDFLLNVSGICARFLADNPEFATHSSLQQLNSILNTSHILLYDKTGTVVASDSTYMGLTLSKNPEDPSYEFRELLYGTPYVIQDEPDEEYLEKSYLYIGSLIVSDEGTPNGFVQLAVDPDFLYSPLKSSSKESLLSTYSGTNGSYVFSVDMKTREFSYHPRTARIGKPAMDYGLTEIDLRDDYVGYIEVKGIRYFAVSAASNEDYIYIATPATNLISGYFRIGMLTFAPCGLIIILVYLLFFMMAESLTRIDRIDSLEDAILPAPAILLQSNDDTPDEEFRSEEVLKRFLKSAFLVLSGVIFLISQFYHRLLPEDSLFTYIIGGVWDNGVHLFSITWCIICICAAGFVTVCLTMLFRQLGQALSSRIKTMVHMLISLLKYAAIIGIFFSCAKRLGVETDTLLASAGILTVVIGLGAQSLTSDVFDGLFIIIEGSFHVGDIISVNDCWGKVLEIGIRNTKILDFDNCTVRIFNNNSLKHIVNHSKKPERIFASIAVEYGDDLRHIEEVIHRELPVINANLPMLVEGAKYLGVDDLADSAVVLKFSVVCRIEDYYVAKRGLNRELKLMFDRNGINVPFPQIVINKRDGED